VSSETGKFSTDIADEVISAAMESVEKHRRKERSSPGVGRPAKSSAGARADPSAELRARLEAARPWSGAREQLKDRRADARAR
jgi:hypothetical protein